jgi:ribonuclease P protein component
VLYVLPNNLPYSRLGIQVKARIGTATRRNYIKRIVREAFRRIKDDFMRPTDLIFIAEREMAEQKYAPFQQEFLAALGRFLK